MTVNYVSKSVFKAKALEIFRAVESSGESVVVTDHGRPTLELRRYQGTVSDPLARLRGSVIRYADPTEPVDADEWDAVR